MSFDSPFTLSCQMGPCPREKMTAGYGTPRQEARRLSRNPHCIDTLRAIRFCETKSGSNYPPPGTCNGLSNDTSQTGRYNRQHFDP
jgi:hypothetical protein